MSNNIAIVKAELQALIDAEGYPFPASIVRIARPETSPLHPYFTWDDSEAAERFRLQQAGALVRRMRVHLVMVRAAAREVAVSIERIETPRTVRMFQSPRSLRGNGSWRLTSDIAKDDAQAAEMVAMLRVELTSWIRRAQDYLDVANAVRRDEPLLQSVVTEVAEIANQAWPSEFAPMVESRDGDGAVAS